MENKPGFDVSAYMEQEKKAQYDVEHILADEQKIRENYEKSKKIAICSFIAAILLLFVTGGVDLIIGKVPMAFVMMITGLKIMILLGVLICAVLTVKNAPNCFATKYDGNWYQYADLYEKFRKDLSEAKNRLQVAQKSISECDRYVSDLNNEEEVLPQPIAMEDGTIFGKLGEVPEEDEEGEYVISLEDALKSLEDEE